jgi:ABC-type nickel/cobalt efflux system permease component RcnA
MRHRTLLGLAGALAAALAVLLPTHPASAHPLGNLTVNTYAGIVVAADAVRVDYVVDLAELPTVQAQQRIDTDGDGTSSAGEMDAYRMAECTTLASGLEVSLGSDPVAVTSGSSSLRFLPGQGGLQTLRLECALRGAAHLDGRRRLTFRDTNLTDRIGWREITMNGDGTTLSGGTVGTATVSNRLLAYPTGRSPLRELDARVDVRPGGPALGVAPVTPGRLPSTAQARGADPLTSWFQHAVGDRDLTLGFGLLALLVAVVLGGLHAMAPGHGKTMMAAYVVGRRGTPRQVAAIGLTVAVTHTGGVLALGTVIWLSQAIAPDRVLPWLTVASGGLLASCGLALLYRRVVLGRTGHAHLRLPGRGDQDHGHDHGEDDDHGHRHHDDHPHDHDHQHDHDHPHDHGHGHTHLGEDHRPVQDPIRRGWLVVMGVAGGLVPTPSALVVLLGAIALHRTWFGVVLVGLYGLGMAGVLMGAGLILVRLQGWLERNWYQRPRAAALLRYLPAITAVLLVGGGLSIVMRGWAQM